MDTTIIPMLAQIPVVGIVVWLVLEMGKRYSSSEAKRDVDWRAFLTDQRQQYTESVSRLTEAIRDISQRHGERMEAISTQQALTTTLLSQHDTITRAALDRIEASPRRGK